MNKKIDFDYYANYFAMIEERLVNTEKYIAFEKKNLETYSLEFASIINDCGSLINGFCTELCKSERKTLFKEKKKGQRYNINDYNKYILNKYSQYISYCVHCGGVIILPWEKLKISEKQIPLWWNEYNKVKHAGKSGFKKATLKTAISCMAGMFSLLCMYDIERFGTRMSNWRGFFRFAGNYNKVVSWEC